ncbi:MAG: glycosyltransferase family 2 protein [Balneolaceae bacterium]|nr:glycosyltransferase family 2 protein [Balneolaceae bacterium]
MKVSIITVALNAENTIQDTIDSVKSQTYPDIEYILLDGDSNDATLEIIQKNLDVIDRWISEKDRGIYDAMNKGIQMANGEIIAFLNADDIYAYPDAVNDMVQLFKKKKVDSCYADLVYVSHKNPDNVLRKWKSGRYKNGMFKNGWMPPHPTFLVKKDIYEKYGMFNLELGTAADYEIMLRFLHKHKISVAYLPKTLIKMRTGGVSNESILNRIRANKNDRKAWAINGLKPKFYTPILKPLRKLHQYF